MNTLDSINVRFGLIYIRFYFDDLFTKELLLDEYGLMLGDNNAISKIEVHFDTVKPINSNLKYVLRGKLKKYTVTIFENKLFVNIKYHRRKNDFYKLISPIYESRYQTCVEDFLHNFFLGFLQCSLIGDGCSLFHCCVFDHFLITGGAQSGKSTLIDYFVQKNVKILAEDFCIVDSLGNVYQLSHKRKVSIDKFRMFSNEKIGFFRKIILKIFKINEYRRVSFKGYYNLSELDAATKINSVFYINRKTIAISKRTETTENFVRAETKILREEFNNFSGFKFFLQESNYNSMDRLMAATSKILANFIENVSKKIFLDIPFLDKSDDFCKLVEAMINE